ncbi:hypothetical protein [Aneurinibacillus aneurinilyticus]|uniref:hypothetical protein n=2 Tax=Aneurinibacillus aneurinilyticus TaxID=1391 RepID=UPI002E1B7361|nr:hypothetical protein [Aneurinibacillus aneurinilyticus]
MFRQYGVKVGIAALLFGLVQYIMNYPMAFIAAALVFLFPYFLQESRALFGDVIRYKQTTEFTASLSSLIRTYGTLERAMEHVKPEKFPAIAHIVRQIRQGMAAGRPASSVFMNAGYEHDNRYLVEIGKLFLILEEQNAKRDYIIERLESLRIAFQNENIDREQGAKVKKRMLKSSLLLNGFVVFVVVTVMPGLIHEPFKFYFRTGLGQVLSTVGVITLLLPHTYVFFLMKARGRI